MTDLLWCVGTIDTPNFTLLGHYFHSDTQKVCYFLQDLYPPVSKLATESV